MLEYIEQKHRDSTVTSRERILKTLKLEKADVIPTTIMDPQPQFSEKYLEGRNQLETILYFDLDPICFLPIFLSSRLSSMCSPMVLIGEKRR